MFSWLSGYLIGKYFLRVWMKTTSFPEWWYTRWCLSWWWWWWWWWYDSNDDKNNVNYSDGDNDDDYENDNDDNDCKDCNNHEDHTMNAQIALHIHGRILNCDFDTYFIADFSWMTLSFSDHFSTFLKLWVWVTVQEIYPEIKFLNLFTGNHF